MLFVWLLLIVIAFYLLAYVTDEYFVASLEDLTHRWNFTSDMTGATFMAVGSSMPELCISLIAVLRPGDHIEIGVGTIVGSAIFNLLIIIGVSACVRRMVVAWQYIVRDFLFYGIAIIMLLWFLYDGRVTMYEALAFIAVYIAYLTVIALWRRITTCEYDEEEGQVSPEEEGSHGRLYRVTDYLFKMFMPTRSYTYRLFFVSLVLIAFLSWILVEATIALAYDLHISEAVIALVIVAIGTSVPDLVASYSAAKRGYGGMAVSNAVGSNIFDILIGLGVPLLCATLMTSEVVIDTKDIFVSVLLLCGTLVMTFLLLVLRRWVLDYKTAIVLIAAYVGYLVWIIWQVM
jgi:K+-dependent Na+/Ca+ exchanger-like protein